MPLMAENRRGWVCTKNRSVLGRAWGVVQPELLRGVMPSSAGTSSLCCPASPGLGVLGTPSFHTAGLGLGTSCCLCVEAQDRNASSWKSSCRSTEHQPHPGCQEPLGPSDLSLPCSVPFTHCRPQSPHLFDQGRHPHPKAPLSQIPLSVGKCWETLEGKHRKEWQLYITTTSLCIRTRAAALLQRLSLKNNVYSPLSKCQALVCNSAMY